MKEFMRNRFLMFSISLLAMVMIFLIIGNVASSEKDSLTMNEKIEDFEYMYNVIEAGFPYLEVNYRSNSVKWLKNKDKYISEIEKTSNDKEYSEVLSNFLEDLNNKDTNLINTKKDFEYFKYIYRDNGWYDFLNEQNVIDRYNKTTDLISNIKEGFFESSHPIMEDVVDGKVAYIYIPKMKVASTEAQNELKDISNYLSKISDYKSLIIDIRGNSGGSDTYWESIVSMLTDEDIKTHGYVLFRGGAVVENYLKGRNISLLPIVDLPEDVLAKSPMEVLNGFSGYIVQDKIIKANKVTNFKGKIYLLVDDKVYSSSELFALFCKKNNFATLIGESTGGGVGGIDPLLFNLPNSGLIVRMASGMYLTSEGECNEEYKTVPDYEVENCERISNLHEDLCIKRAIELGNEK